MTLSTGVVTRLVRTAPGTDLPPPGALLGTLDHIERERAGRFADPSQAARFMTGRSALRDLAAELLGVDPARLLSDFTCPRCSPDGGADHGRPGYLIDGDPVPLALSLSRAPGFALLGVLLQGGLAPGDGQGLGVDVTAVSGVRFDGFDDVALTLRERRSVRDMPPADRDDARARLWARKEALAKALGSGFSTGAGSGALDPGDLEVLDDARITDLREIDGVLLAEEGLAAAVAVTTDHPVTTDPPVTTAIDRLSVPVRAGRRTAGPS
ncbi:4'-phosphopantetheinyl transferase family protein [Arthrobacter sp. MDT2-2]